MVFFKQNDKKLDKRPKYAGGNEGGAGGSSGGSTGEMSSEKRMKTSLENDAVDAKFGFERIKEMVDRTGWLLNMHTTEVLDDDKRLVSAVDYYFIDERGGRFKTTLAYKPYFYVLPKIGTEKEVSLFLLRKFGGTLVSVETLAKEDLDLPNHLVGLKQNYLKLSFLSVNDLMKVRKDILPAVKKNKEREKSHTAYADMLRQSYIGDASVDLEPKKGATEQMDNMVDIREYDVPYHVRVAIDKKMFIGHWYTVTPSPGNSHIPKITKRPDIIESPDCIVLAYDIETTKLPLKFPDVEIDQVMMISYMIDGQGFLITNREIVSSDVDDFEYTPKPEYEGLFTVFNEPNEKMLIQRFFDHILDVKPHIFATYNGDFFDWKFVEARAAHHGLSMLREIGFSVVRDKIYSCRPCIHMDCFNWVQRDSYLPVGSQNLKAVAKAKLRYDPVELDPEDMCRMASEQPQVLSNYSVSDAVATYYLYMKYVHPFIFALCTIIPMEPDEVLRKGSGTLCEALLMVEAFHANIIFPNKQESELNKMTPDGHILDSETYVGGHVEALESGVFRADINYKFRMIPSIFNTLLTGIDKALKHAIEEEENVPLTDVINFDEVVSDIKAKLEHLRDHPIRNEKPLIYHLDVGAMYPNIILTNRLQPSAMVDETVCAACDFNKQGAQCQRDMLWTWRGEYMPPSRSEFQRIQQQLEMERFPPLMPGGRQRQFHELTKEERAEIEKKRLQDYSRKAYKKTHITRIEERNQVVCQRENSFYVDTVRAFRDRRYEYKGLGKTAKKEVADAIASGDPGRIKSAKNREVLYDSLQLAHKCILNSFYGYVMRKGARWHSMEMAGIVCHTGANIIRKAREIIEKVGRPLELDTDGIWCMLPASFPENFTILTRNPKKSELTISYPNTVLNIMVKDEFTNDQYHELKDAQSLNYEVRAENSIFFEVDGPYLSMILPAAKEEGKKLKKRYAVFNFDRSLAELKGFEVKRRGELQLIKNFQSSVFDAFLNGDSLEGSYESVARVADYWLDVLYSKAANMPDSELFELISENRSMSKKLEDYGKQKSTSISTAKRLAEFLGDQMVKDAGLSCRFIITRKPDGAPVTERAIPLAIFQAEFSVKKHFLRRWLKDNSIDDFDIRGLLDWDYYIERLGGCIQKIVTIPAALQGIANPVPRVAHPDWLHKKMLEKNDVFKQRKITDVFQSAPKPVSVPRDIEDINGSDSNGRADVIVINTNSKRKRPDTRDTNDGDGYTKHWKDVLGAPPPIGTDRESMLEWISFHKKKWKYQKEQRKERQKRLRTDVDDDSRVFRRPTGPVTLGGFLKRAQRTLLDTPWQIIQLMETNQPGVVKLWALVGNELHLMKLNVPRIFYLNSKEQKPESETYRKCVKLLPRAHQAHNLYEYSIPEELFIQNSNELDTDIATNPTIDGVYETQMPLLFRAIVNLGCICTVDRQAAGRMKEVGDTFELDQLSIREITKDCTYLDLNTIKFIFLYHHQSGSKKMTAVFIPVLKKAVFFLVDTVRTTRIPNLAKLYSGEREKRLSKGDDAKTLMEDGYKFESRAEVNQVEVNRYLQRVLQSYRDEKRGPTFVAVQSQIPCREWIDAVPVLGDFPLVPIHMTDLETLYTINPLDWQTIGCRQIVKHFLRIRSVLDTSIGFSKYLNTPIGNLDADVCTFGCDVLYARHLMKNNYVLWCSPSEKPDLGGKEADDSRLVTEFEEHNSIVINHPGCYQAVCVELELEGLAVNTLMQAHHVHDIEGTCATVAFDNMPASSLEEMMNNGQGPALASYDETALCSNAFRILRGMVNVWLRDVSIKRDQYADYLLMAFYRWLRSPQAMLYDPALRKTLNNLMKKLFIQLVAEFMRLGAVIVYADFSRIIISTKKYRVSDATTYVNYITANIKNREIFHTIDIKVKRSWEFMMWLDFTNFAGVKARPCKTVDDSRTSQLTVRDKSKSKDNDDDSGSEEEDLEELNLSDDDDQPPEVEMNWAIMHYLPEVGYCQRNFKTIIASYILTIHKHFASEIDGIEPGTTPVRRRGTQTPRRQQQNNPLLANSNNVAKNVVRGDLAQDLYLIVQKLDKKYPTYVKPTNSTMPTYSISASSRQKPALEFIKAIYKVLSLDPTIEEDAYKLRRDLLKLIGVGEFSTESEWKDPCVSVILPEIICKVCNECRNLDLCKDPFIDTSEKLPRWLCPTCQSVYETDEIELTLVDLVNRKLMAYVLQDLQCSKCHQVKPDNIKIRCECAGVYLTTLEKQQTKERLRTFKEIAEHFGMPLLHHNVDWILKMSAQDKTA